MSHSQRLHTTCRKFYWFFATYICVCLLFYFSFQLFLLRGSFDRRCISSLMFSSIECPASLSRTSSGANSLTGRCKIPLDVFSYETIFTWNQFRNFCYRPQCTMDGVAWASFRWTNWPIQSDRNLAWSCVFDGAFRWISLRWHYPNLVLFPALNLSETYLDSVLLVRMSLSTFVWS